MVLQMRAAAPFPLVARLVRLADKPCMDAGMPQLPDGWHTLCLSPMQRWKLIPHRFTLADLGRLGMDAAPYPAAPSGIGCKHHGVCTANTYLALHRLDVAGGYPLVLRLGSLAYPAQAGYPLASR
jgi:hypothetical protein